MAVLQVAGESSRPDAGSDSLLCMSQLNLSARTYHRTRSAKLARTIADWVGSQETLSVQLAEMLHTPDPLEVYLTGLGISYGWSNRYRIQLHRVEWNQRGELLPPSS